MHRTFVAFVFACSLLFAGVAASQQGVWNDGSPSRVEHRCVLGIDLVDTIEDLAWTWVGFFRLPQVGQVYYARITVGGAGCSGAWGIPEVKLPRGTSFAITQQNPVRCYMQHVYNTSCLSQNDVGFELIPAAENEPDTTIFMTGGCNSIGDGGSSCYAKWSGFQPDTLYVTATATPAQGASFLRWRFNDGATSATTRSVSA